MCCNSPMSGLIGQRAYSPGQRPVDKAHRTLALEGHKRCICQGFCPLRVRVTNAVTPGNALGWWLIALLGHIG